MPLEEAARTGGRVTVADLQRSASMPIEDGEDGRGQTMGALGAPGLLEAHKLVGLKVVRQQSAQCLSSASHRP